MRRMRDIWYYFLFAVPAVAAVLGVRYFLHKSYENSSGFSAMKPSVYKTETAKAPKEKDKGKPVAKKEETQTAAATTAAKTETTPTEKFGSAQDVTQLKAAADALFKESDRSPATEPNSGDTCQSIEYRGDSLDKVIPSREDWASVMGQFHDIKKDMSYWLEKRKDYFSKATYDVMSAQIKNLRIQRPPTLDEPDLSWRGIGVFTRTQNGTNLIRLGGGYIELTKKDPARSRFEMARLVAQAWAPCEIKKNNGGEPWSKLLSCLKITESTGCGSGSYSDTGWAVSSAVAWDTNKPKCTLPAFKDVEAVACLKEFNPHTAKNEPSHEKKTWKEARR